MEVLLAEEYGFCFGVERAVEMVEEVVEEGARPIRSLGPLIHNAQEMERLGAQGVSTIDSPDEADGDTIAVIRAHGVTPQVQRDLEQRAAKVSAEALPWGPEGLGHGRFGASHGIHPHIDAGVHRTAPIGWSVTVR